MSRIMPYEFIHAKDVFDDDNEGLVYGINWLDDMGRAVDSQWFRTKEERQKCIDDTINEVENH